MTVIQLQKILEGWSPREIAWERDNVGLQVGKPKGTIRGILVALDVTERIIEEAVTRKANLIVSHHPLLFNPVPSVNEETETGRCIRSLLRRGMNVLTVHTNLDFSRGGTSFALAEVLGLRRVEFLHRGYKLQKKIVTFVPPDHVEKVAQAMAAAGAGRIGNYENCSFRSEGTGTFQGNEKTNPEVGSRGVFERIREVRLEMIASEVSLERVIGAMVTAHPYEEVAYDIYPIENPSPDYGMGVIGDLPKPIPVSTFLRNIKKALKIPCVRASTDRGRSIKRVAVCGGSGSELLDKAIRQGVDAFVTADIRYHTFHDAHDRIVLVDAGHYETERPIVDALVRRLKTELKRLGEPIAVYSSRYSTNPIVYV
jgi:dinuclear metal center YbgI/SA1388 family protein